MKIAKLEDAPEIFYSLQGEGKECGRPSIFVRLSLCNLYCVWCDTDYTWNWQNTPFSHDKDRIPGYSKFVRGEQILEMSPLQVAEAVRKYPCTNVVFTGGEPLLQQRDCVEVMEVLRSFDHCYRFDVETNGSVVPQKRFDSCVNLYNVSPKLANSRVSQKKRERVAAYRFFSKEARAIFKFVIVSQEDIFEVLELAERYCIAPGKIYLMPEGISSEQLRDRRLWLVEICKQYGFYFGDRLHIHVYGAGRGV